MKTTGLVVRRGGGGCARLVLGVDGEQAARVEVLYDYEACGPGLAF